MQVCIFISCTTTVQLTLDDVEQAADFSDHIAKGAPDDADVSHEGSTVTVLRTFATEKAAEDWAREVREGMEKGRLFNLDISDVSDIPIQ
jgi:hypothetical protein